ncbi:uncharacterized protein [Prorops nasuta]|uniref:uncharacterized protein n=1 Tax=Prorops nasuta TaxID=863751 RepID=UPI0034CD84B7
MEGNIGRNEEVHDRETDQGRHTGSTEDSRSANPSRSSIQGTENIYKPEVEPITEVRLPPFWKSDPDLWFIQVEAQFNSRRVRGDQRKYDLIIASLDPEALKQVSDVVRKPPCTERYEHLKASLIARLTDSQERQLQKLLGELQLGDKKPSQLLREMRELGGGIVHEDLLRSRWIHAMPTSVQSFLVMSSEFDLPKLAEVADRLLENCPTQFVMETTKIPPKPEIYEVRRTESSEKIEALLGNLTGEIQGLAKLVKEMGKQVAAQNKQTRDRSRSRARSVPRNKDNNICYFHTRFGDQAKGCTTPCGYITTKQTEN